MRHFVFGLVCLLAAVGLSLGQTDWGQFNRAGAAHGVQGKIRIINTKTIQIVNFFYDGGGPDAFLYYYPPGVPVIDSGRGFTIPLPNGRSEGQFVFGQTYNNQELTVTLPDGVDACDIGTVTIWCRRASQHFNEAQLTRDIFENGGNDPCTIKASVAHVTPTSPPGPSEFHNCIFLHESLQMRWKVNRNDSNVRVQLCGCLPFNSVNQYMGFGVSGSDSSTSMFRADPTITWVDTNSQANAIDYHLSGYTQCLNGVGACPDQVSSGGSCSNDVVNVTGFKDNRQQCVSFTRPFMPADVGTCDRQLNVDDEQYVVWAIGPGGPGGTAFRHFTNAPRDMMPLHLGRPPVDECGSRVLTCPKCSPFVGQRIVAREDTTFRAVIGPSGNQRGYTGITDLAGWGIAWYINGILVPELVVQRGSTYTFTVEGGDDPSRSAEYHPFYITNSNKGGRIPNRENYGAEVVYAGFNERDQPTGVGRYCSLEETPAAIAARDSCSSNLNDYLSKLVEGSSCSQGQPGTVTWTPDLNTPDTVYYQCATHIGLGWRIRIVNKGEPLPPDPNSAVMHAVVNSVSVIMSAMLAIWIMS